jgi:hypothetical protein
MWKLWEPIGAFLMRLESRIRQDVKRAHGKLPRHVQEHYVMVEASKMADILYKLLKKKEKEEREEEV